MALEQTVKDIHAQNAQFQQIFLSQGTGITESSRHQREEEEGKETG